ncbi:MAG: hypothetical protein AVDCRST_MAG96-2559 [uncultured Segetibacter sp.]|uniref:Uncharacterized protein n=1 Tax=uncultured Segetibacter sp. TaxID=481133 RepID=A0A6J4T4Z1_9BACT|nr:MAG: hypothetical protein AVDCRST_MAG96-2559 [uncultured Segetibacter sp.]
MALFVLIFLLKLYFGYLQNNSLKHRFATSAKFFGDTFAFENIVEICKKHKKNFYIRLRLLLLPRDETNNSKYLV